MRALNFYSAQYHSQLVNRRKTCTVRLGDKTHKYAEGDIVWVTVGKRFSPRQKIFTAVLDRVWVKTISQLTSEDLQGENPALHTTGELLQFLQSIYKKELSPDDTVTVIYFSEIIA